LLDANQYADSPRFSPEVVNTAGAAGTIGLAHFVVALTPAHLAWCLLGTTLGTAIGVLPGIGPALTVSLLLPVTFGVEPTAALIMFAGLYYGAMFGGSTTSILLNTPGESATVAFMRGLGVALPNGAFGERQS